MPSVFHREAYLDGYLPMADLRLTDITACFDHLEPTQVLDGLVRPSDGIVNGVLDGSRRRAGEFDEFTDGIFHAQLSQ